MSKARIEWGATAREKHAEHLIDQWCAAQPAPPKEREIDAPLETNSGQPSFYGKGTNAVVSTIRVGPCGRTTSETKTVAWGDLASYGLDPARAPTDQRGQRSAMITRVPGKPWRFWRLPRRKRTTDLTTHVQVHATRPVVLHDLEPRPIYCESYAQAQAECERVGKTILR